MQWIYIVGKVSWQKTGIYYAKKWVTSRPADVLKIYTVFSSNTLLTRYDNQPNEKVWAGTECMEEKINLHSSPVGSQLRKFLDVDYFSNTFEGIAVILWLANSWKIIKYSVIDKLPHSDLPILKVCK